MAKASAIVVALAARKLSKVTTQASFESQGKGVVVDRCFRMAFFPRKLQDVIVDRFLS